MKRILSKHGFTIVEVMVAFVIFAIMAAMVSMILAQVNNARRQNADIQDEIEVQKSVYYLKDQDKKYDAKDKEGELSFNFDGATSFDIDYSIGDPNAETDENLLALDYFIGNVNYDSAKNTNKDTKDENGNNVGSVTTRLDSRVYGSNGITNITAKITRDNSYTGTGYRYFIKSMATYNGVDDQKWFAQYRFIFPSAILDYGYTQQSDSPSTISSRFESSSSYQFEVYSPYNRTLRVSSKQSSTESSPPAVATRYLYYYVVLSDPLEDIDSGLDLNKIFGYSSSDQSGSKTEYGSYTFTSYVETIKNEDGSASTVTYPNIFGAFPKPEEKIPSDEP